MSINQRLYFLLETPLKSSTGHAELLVVDFFFRWRSSQLVAVARYAIVLIIGNTLLGDLSIVCLFVCCGLHMCLYAHTYL